MVLPNHNLEAEADHLDVLGVGHTPDQGQDRDQQEEVVHVPVTMIAPLSGMIEEIQEVDPDPELLKTETEEVAAEVPLQSIEMIKSTQNLELLVQLNILQLCRTNILDCVEITILDDNDIINEIVYILLASYIRFEVNTGPMSNLITSLLYLLPYVRAT